MKSSVNILCVLLVVMFCSHRWSEAKNLCKDFYGPIPGDNPWIRSIFNLDYDIVLQVIRKNADSPEFWIIQNADTRDPTHVNSDIKFYQQNDFFPEPDAEESPLDGFDGMSPIFGYIPDADAIYMEYQSASVIKPPGVPVCLHGIPKNPDPSVAMPTMVRMYNYNFERLIRIKPEFEDQFVNKYCITGQPIYRKRFLPEEERIVSFVNWFDTKENVFEPIFSNISILEFKNKSAYTKETIYVPLLGTFPVHSLREIRSIMNESFPIIFRFVYPKYREYFLCEKNCRLHSSLIKMKVTEPFGRLEYIKTNNIQLKKLLGCPLYDKPSINFHEFCAQSELISVFNLGFDIFFQSEGLFWQMPYNRYEEETNGRKNYKIRVHSDFTAFLGRDLFDMSFPIFGFSFNSEISEDCNRDDKNCNQMYLEERQTYHVCLYGKRKSEDWSDSKHWQRGYYYSPGGLFSLPKIDGQNDNQFCNPIREIPGELITTLVDLPTSGLKNIVYALYKSPDSLYTWKWPFGEAPTAGNTEKIKHVMYFGSAPLSLFFVRLNQWPQPNDPQSVNQMYVFDQKTSLVRRFTTNGISPTENKTIYDLFNCPFETTVALMTNRRERVCERQKPSSVQGVFTLGNRFYHQIGQHFYFFDENSKRFRYDRHLSDLLDVYFNTRDRVTAYSFHPIFYPNKYKSFNVLITGKSGHNYQRLVPNPQYFDRISFLFSVNASVPFLKVLKRTKDSFDESVFSNMDTNLMSPANCPADLTRTFFNDAMGGFYISHGITRWTCFPAPGQRVNPVDSAYEEEDSNLIERAQMPGWVERVNLAVDFARSHNILGVIYDMKTKKVMAVAYDEKLHNNLNLYELDPNLYKPVYDPDNEAWVKKASFNEPFLYFRKFIPLKASLKILDYYDTYCESPQMSEDLENSSDKTLKYIFYFLLIILLILAITTAYLTYKKSQTKDETKSKSNTKDQTLSPNRPNYTVVQQSEPNTDKTETKDFKTENQSSDKSVRTEEI